MYTSTSLVLLPPVQESFTRDVKTEIRIAGSEVVLGPAGRQVRPPLSPETLASQVRITAPTSDVIQIRASAETPDTAMALSQAVADSEVAYARDQASSVTNAQGTALARRQRELEASLETVNDEIEKTSARRENQEPDSPEGRADATALAQLTAQQANLVLQMDQLKESVAGGKSGAGATIIQDASPATRPGLVAQFVVPTMFGLVAAVVIAAMLLVLLARRDRRLRFRDDIADALGSPVIASINSRPPRAVAGWISLLQSYTPGAVEAWALRQALRQLAASESQTVGRQRGGSPDRRHPVSVTVVTLSDDARALAVGPQIAVHAADTGVRTQLVAAQGHDSAAALWAACASVDGPVQRRPDLVVGVATELPRDAELTVVLAVVDRREPHLHDLPDTAATLFVVSSGSATAEDLARAAVAADDSGRRISGVIVADPDDRDRTTGRLLQPDRSRQVPLPTRLTGVTTAPPVGGKLKGLRGGQR
jgi:capsular polysaccharide biosynthesis protein